MAVFRVEKTRDYTVMANHHLKNRELTLKAKGLLSVMLSLPEDWDYTLKGLSRINREGVDAIREAVKELERAGYVVRSRNKNAKGQFADIEYVIYEQPRKPCTEAQEPAPKKPMLENPILDKPTLGKPVQGNPALDMPALEKPASENPTQLNTDRTIPYPEKKEKSIPYAANPDPSIPYPSNTRKTPLQIQGEIHDRIGYEALVYQYDRQWLDELVSLMVEVLCSKSPTFTISGEEQPAFLVHQRLESITSLHIQYVHECMSKNASNIRNIKGYLLAVLFNAPATLGNYYAAQYRHNSGL